MSTTRPIIGIAGYGMEGKAVYEYFKDTADIHIFDEQHITQEGLHATVHNTLSVPKEVEIVYKSPGIPTSKLVLASHRTKISTFMNLVLEKVHDRAIGVTGTKGKSTVTALIHHVLTQSGHPAVLFGNIGIADAKTLREDRRDARYVIELSSYQCEHLTHSPRVAVLTNFYPEHLSHHGSLSSYRNAKLNIARFQKIGDIFINGSQLESAFAGRVIHPDVSAPVETKLLGEHNQRNCAIALTVLSTIGIPEHISRQYIKTFTPLPYRLEEVGTSRDITFFDDSLATIPEATLASLEALPRVDTLILGGEDRGISFDAFAQALPESGVRTFIIFPETGEKMVTRVDPESVVRVSSMEEAVREAFRRTPKGGIVLLSNASPSFNLFKDYKDKSAQYREAIKRASMTP